MRWLFLLLTFLLAPLAWAGSININTATAAELEGLPGIGPSKAAAIVEYRTQNGPFASVDQLDNVAGIGPATLAGLRDAATVGDGTGAAPSTDPAPAASTDEPAPAPAPAAAPSAGGKVNINTATSAELQTLPGIGPTKATAIIDDRTANGPFSSCSDLSRVTGIGPATISSIGDLCVTK